MAARCIDAVFEPLLIAPWVLDVDATVKRLHCKEEEARVSCNRAPEWRSPPVVESPAPGGIGMTGQPASGSAGQPWRGGSDGEVTYSSTKSTAALRIIVRA